MTAALLVAAQFVAALGHQWVWIAIASWTILAVLIAAGCSRGGRSLNHTPRREWYVTDGDLWTYPAPDADEVNWLPFLPPVPPSRDPLDAEIEALLAAGQ